MSKKQDGDGWIRRISELVKLPTDVMCEDTRVSMIGKSRVRIENYRSILVYSETQIKIQARRQIVVVEGSQLQIRYYDQDEMEIYGRITCIKCD